MLVFDHVDLSLSLCTDAKVPRSFALATEAELARGELLAAVTDSGAHILSWDQERSSVSVYSPDENVDVRVRCVVVIDGHPLQATAEIPLDAIDELSCMCAQVELLSLPRIDNHLPEPGVFVPLPPVQPLPQVHLVALGVEAEATLMLPLPTRARQVAPVRIPGAADTQNRPLIDS